MKIKGLSNLSCCQLVSQRFFLHFVVFSGFFLILGLGCSKLELTRAFDGEFNKVKNNKLINAYCTSCHNHKEFDSKQHILKVRQKYKRKLFRSRSECRTCHYLEKMSSKDHIFRKTRRPKQANRGDFREFEKNY